MKCCFIGRNVTRRHRIKRCVAILFLITSLVSCAAPSEVQNNDAPPTSNTDSTSPSSAAVLKLCDRESSDGFYSIASVRGNSFNIFYTDYVTRQQIFLCDAPNCDHASEACTSYFYLSDTEIPPSVITDGDYLYIMRNMATENVPYNIYVVNKNGTDRRGLVQLESYETLNGGIYTDGTWLYYEVWSVAETDNGPVNVSRLERVNRESGEIQKVFDLPKGYVIYSTAGGRYVVSTSAEGLRQPAFCYLHLPVDGQEAYLETEPFYTPTSDEMGAFVLNGKLIAYDAKTARLTVRDLADDTVQEIDCSADLPPYDPEWQVTISYLYGGCSDPTFLRMMIPHPQPDGTTPVTERIIDTRKGTVSTDLQMAADDGHIMMPVARYGDSFCLITGYDEIPFSYTDDNGNLQASTLSLPRYGLITIDDFLAGNANILPVTNPKI